MSPLNRPARTEGQGARRYRRGGQDACRGKSSLPGPIAALIGERDRVAIHRRSELGAFGEGSFSAPIHRWREISTGPKAQHIKRPTRLDEASTRWSTVLQEPQRQTKRQVAREPAYQSSTGLRYEHSCWLESTYTKGPEKIPVQND
jgi:hypothetical protein